MSSLPISAVIGRGGWRTVDDPYLRAARLEELDRAREVESAMEAEAKRCVKAGEVRALAERFGWAEYVPAGDESIEELELRGKAIWRKAFRYGITPKQMQAEAEIVAKLRARWLAREAQKAAEWKALFESLELSTRLDGITF